MITGTPATIADMRGETATINGARLHYRIGGDAAGPPVVLWHGCPFTGYAWRKVAPALVAAGMAVLAPDLPG